MVQTALVAPVQTVVVGHGLMDVSAEITNVTYPVFAAGLSEDFK